MKKLLAPALVAFVGFLVCSLMVSAFHMGIANAQAPDAGSGSATVAAAATGSGSDIVPLPATTVPADKIHDPLSNPQAAFDDVKAAKKIGWGVLALTVLLIACRLASRLGGIFTKLGQGKFALGVAAVGAFAMTAYNAVLLGGTWIAALFAAMMAGAAAWDSKAKSTSPGS